MERGDGRSECFETGGCRGDVRDGTRSGVVGGPRGDAR